MLSKRHVGSGNEIGFVQQCALACALVRFACRNRGSKCTQHVECALVVRYVVQYFVLKSCDRLAWTLPIANREFIQPRRICPGQRRLKSELSLVPFRVSFGLKTILGSIPVCRDAVQFQMEMLIFDCRLTESSIIMFLFSVWRTSRTRFDGAWIWGGKDQTNLMAFMAWRSVQTCYMTMQLMSFNFHKKLRFTLRISVVNPPFVAFVLLLSRTAFYCVRQRTQSMQWTGPSLHHVTDTYYKKLTSTCNPNWIR